VEDEQLEALKVVGEEVDHLFQDPSGYCESL
jgi:hypothetical protein